MKTTTITSMKFLRLKRKLGLPHWQAVGLLESLWVFAMANAMAGDIGRHSNEDIAAALEWAGDPDQLINNLIETGWLDRHPECRLSIHDWEDHCPNFVKGVMANKGKSFVSKVLPSPQPSHTPSPQPSPQPSHTPSPVLESPTQGVAPSNLTLPNITKANLTKAEGVPHQDTPAHELTTAWNFYARGSRPGNETFPKVIEVFSEALRRGITPAAIAAAIADPKRDRTEPLFLFSDRELRPQQRRGPAAPKSTEELFNTMTADPREKAVLEVAFNGRN
jgi:hypothetical protein